MHTKEYELTSLISPKLIAEANQLNALDLRRKARRAYKQARSRYMGFVTSHNDWSDDPRMAQAREAAIEAWRAYEWADCQVTLATGEGFDNYAHKP